MSYAHPLHRQAKKPDGRALAGLNLGDFLGSRKMLPLYSRSGVEARRNSPIRCEATTRAGLPCERLPAPNQKCCHIHLKGAARYAHELEMERRYMRIIEKGAIPFREERARRGLEAIARKRFHRAWVLDPRMPSETIAFATDHDRLRCIEWLATHTVIHSLTDVLPETGRPPTPRCIDRMLWAAWRAIRNGHTTEEFLEAAKKRVRIAIKDDATFWKKWDAAGGDTPDGEEA